MKRYNSYKDSGVQWIGEIPSHWEVCKCSLPIPNIGSGTTPTSTKKEYYTEDGNGYNWLQTGDLNDGVISSTSKHVTELAVKECNLRFYPKNSVVIAMYGATIGKVGYLSIETSTNQACCVLPPNNGINSKYIQYIFLSAKPQLLVDAIGGGQPNISQDVIKNTRIPLPDFSEQTAIANYLDNKCAKIDNVIATQEKRVDLLRELKQSIITRAVTRGINPDAKMKDSGVEWIGEIPEHWEVMKLNNVCHTITDFVASGSFADLRDNVQYLDEPDYAMLVRTADLSQKNREVAKVYVSKDSYDFLRNSNLNGGEIVLPNIGASIGDAYVVPKDMYEKMTLGPNSILLRTNYNDMFFYYYFCSKSGRESLILMGQAAAQSKFNKTELRQMKVIVPPIEEQQQIVTHIEQQTSKLDSSITKALRQIELLKEYKQSLITEVVTGKRKVC